MFSHIIQKVSRQRELSIDVAEHRSILKNKGVVRILVIIQDRLKFSHIIQKASAGASDWCGWTNPYLEKWLKYVLPLFYIHTKN